MKIDNERVGFAINTIRKFLLKQKFFEVHLYCTTNYKIKNTDTFKIKQNVFLRYNPEPDIWQDACKKHDKFFWIGSIFRNEKKLSPLHSYEFTLADIYQSGNKEDIKRTFISILKVLENKLELKPLSKEFFEIDYKDSFKEIMKNECWIIVNNYPTHESFYDVRNKNGTTKKFEFFYKRDTEIIEIVAGGELGENYNQKNFIKGEKNIVKNFPKKSLFGFGIGIERLLSLYSAQ